MIFSVPSSRSVEPVEIVGDDDAHVGADAGALVLRDPFHQGGRIGEGIVAEGEGHALGAGVELLDIGDAAERLDRGRA